MCLKPITIRGYAGEDRTPRELYMAERRMFLRTLSLSGAVAAMIALATIGVQERAVSAASPAVQAPARAAALHRGPW